MRGEWGAQVVPGPGHQVAAQGIELLLLLVSGLQALRHLVERLRQGSDLIAAARWCARADRLPSSMAAGGGFQPGNALGEGAGKETAQRHGNAAGKDQQNRRQQQVMLAGKHQPGSQPDVEKCQQAGKNIRAHQRPAQGRGALQPAQAVGAEPNDNGDGGSQRQELRHVLQVAHRRAHQPVENTTARREKRMTSELIPLAKQAGRGDGSAILASRFTAQTYNPPPRRSPGGRGWRDLFRFSRAGGGCGR